MTTRRLTILAAALATALLAAGAALGAGQARNVQYVFRGHLLAAPPANATSVSLSVEGGNRIGLKAMLGQSVDQSFAVGSATEFLRWSDGVPTVVHAGDLAAGDWVVVRIRAPRGAALSELESRPAGIVADRGPNPGRPDQPLYLFRGRIAVVGSGSVTVDVRGGNRRGLRLLIGQGAQQTFATGPETIFLLWQGKVPTVISAAQLKVGDAVVVRVRAAARSSLAQVEATPAVHVGEHEPKTTTVTS
jgi:hypothetical protein